MSPLLVVFFVSRVGLSLSSVVTQLCPRECLPRPCSGDDTFVQDLIECVAGPPEKPPCDQCATCCRISSSDGGVGEGCALAVMIYAGDKPELKQNIGCRDGNVCQPTTPGVSSRSSCFNLKGSDFKNNFKNATICYGTCQSPCTK